MKKSVILGLALIAGSATGADLIVPQGTKATLQVNYQFKSSGKYAASGRERRADWNVLRDVTITAHYEANPPQPFGALHKDDPKQKKDIATMQTSIENMQTRMQPTMQDMMKIADKCGEDEGCISREIENYGKQMDPSIVKAGKEDAATIGKMATDTRFQMWRLTTMTGTYSVDERMNEQIFEMTCTETQVCKRSKTRSGAGNILPPPGFKSVEGTSMLEVDSRNKDMFVTLPMPLAPLPYTQTVTTTVPWDEGAGTTKEVSSGWMAKASEQGLVAIPGDLKTLSGTQTYKVEGHEEAAGTLTVKWTFTRQ
jgi:hypothetical protein